MGKFSIDTAIQRVLDKGDKAFVLISWPAMAD